jgi:hypothetical protein
VRGLDGRLTFHHSGGDTFAIRGWLAADADGRDDTPPGHRGRPVEDRAKPESDRATSRAQSDDATPREEDIEAE